MNEKLARLLDFLEDTLDAERQADAEALCMRALSYQPVQRLPLVMVYPLPEDFAFRRIRTARSSTTRRRCCLTNWSKRSG